MSNIKKNRMREAPSFANINMLGKCNADCFFCLGKDIDYILNKQNQMQEHFKNWKNFDLFLEECKKEGIKKIYLTGQNTDPLLYCRLGELIDHIQAGPFKCGIRTNGYLAEKEMANIGLCKEEIGYSIHSLSPMVNKMILGRKDIPNWDKIIRTTQSYDIPVRISIVINRCNYHEFWDLIRYLSKFNLPYVQVRKVSTDFRQKELFPDIKAYEELYTLVSNIFPLKQKIWKDADIYEIFGVDVVFWRTVQTSVNSWNYFTDGTISKEYFIIEGYLKSKSR